MECKRARNDITKYLDKTLSERSTQKLMKHIDECEECKEELKLHYIVKEGLERLENGGTLDLQKEFDQMILDTKTRNKQLNKLDMLVRIIFIASFAYVALVLIRSLIF